MISCFPRHRFVCLFAAALCTVSLIKSIDCLQAEVVGDLETTDDIGLPPAIDTIEDFEVNPEDENDKSKFTWRNHQEDHGVYAHRSLSSTENIKRNREDTTDKLEYGELLKKTSRLNKHQDDEDDPLKTSDYAEKEWQLMFRALDLTLDGVSSSVLQQIGQRTNLFEEVVSRLEPECRNDIYHMKDSLKKHKLWALRMVDSNGKIPSGITYGKFSSPGDYEECLSVRVDEQIYSDLNTTGASSSLNHSNKKDSLKQYKFHGKYCLIDFRLPLPERPPGKLLSIHDPVIDLSNTEIAKVFPEIANYSGFAAVFYELGFLHGICLPSSCDVTDLTKSIGYALEGMHIIVNNTIDCEEIFDEPKPWTTAQIISITLLTLLFINVTGASTVHHYQSKERKREARKFLHLSSAEREKFEESHRQQASVSRKKGSGLAGRLLDGVRQSKFYSDCFSIQTNFERLSKPDPRGLTFVHYTRIIAMGLTVITHTAGMGTLQAITKPADASNSEQIFRDFIPQMLANAFTSIQIFFFMAGFMLVISTYPSIRRDKGHISFLEYAIKRAIRLMPGIAATICINFVWPLLVDGPMLTFFVRAIVTPCETTWWRTLCFLSNFDHVEKMCLRHSYFSASDYQLHIMAFPLIILLYKQPAISLTIAGLLTVGGFVAQVIMVLTKSLTPFMMVDYIDKEALFNVVHYIHHPVWNHMSAFFYGFIIGYMVVKQIRIDISEKNIKRIWCTLLPLGIAAIFAPYFWNHYKRPIYKWQMVLYVIIDRFILLTTCAWLSYASMVLSRPKPKPSPASQANLPSIVTLQTQDKDKQRPEATTGGDGMALPQIVTTEAEQQSRASLVVGPVAAGMLRQQSSPNVRTLNDQGEQAKLRPAVSSVDVNEQAPRSQEVEGKPDGSNNGTQQQQPKKLQAPVSNVNTLCLILSRLTFQLYLFNMVVLWIDVNHSKYSWFFSYYFIITKALAVYICSSIMATIFFITLESPALTLYIAWVKSRAQAQAYRRTRRDNAKTDDSNGKFEQRQQPQGVNSNQAIRGISQSPKFTRPQSTTGSRQSPDGSFDGLCMRMGPDFKEQQVARPTFSFIDLSEKESGIANSDQTKM